MNSSAWKTLLLSATAAAMVWALSPWVTGQWEPWDANGVYYPAALLVGGALVGLLSPRPLWAHYLGAFVGQLGYELVALRAGPLFVLGMVFLLGYTMVFLVGAAIAGLVRRRLAPKPAPGP
jgi:hypothetical protein